MYTKIQRLQLSVTYDHNKTTLLDKVDKKPALPSEQLFVFYSTFLSFTPTVYTEVIATNSRNTVPTIDKLSTVVTYEGYQTQDLSHVQSLLLLIALQALLCGKALFSFPHSILHSLQNDSRNLAVLEDPTPRGCVIWRQTTCWENEWQRRLALSRFPSPILQIQAGETRSEDFVKHNRSKCFSNRVVCLTLIQTSCWSGAEPPESSRQCAHQQACRTR